MSLDISYGKKREDGIDISKFRGQRCDMNGGRNLMKNVPLKPLRSRRKLKGD